jgi:hypothetical protein
LPRIVGADADEETELKTAAMTAPAYESERFVITEGGRQAPATFRTFASSGEYAAEGGKSRGSDEETVTLILAIRHKHARMR